MNIPLLLEMVAEALPGRVLLGSKESGVTAGSLLRAVEAGARWLRGEGVTRVGFLGLNGESFPLALLASARAGLPFAPLNYRLTDEGLRVVLNRLAPAMVVADEDMLPRCEAIDRLRLMPAGEFVRRVAGMGGVEGDWAEDGGACGSGGLPLLEGDEIAVLLFTSGTTGEPKTAVLRQRHMASYVLDTVEFLSASEEEAQLVSVPAYHIAGVASVLSSLFAGRRIVYLPAFDAKGWIQLARRQTITQAMVVPTMLERILDVLEEDGEGLPALRLLSYGGGRAPLELVERAMRLLPGVDLVNAYGLTETSSTITALTPEDHRECFASANAAVRRRLGSVGRPLPSVEIQIRSRQGVVLPPGEVGEIYVRGAQIAGEYASGSVLDAEGWFPTRDAGWMDADGFLYLAGRLDDVIVRGGENLSPGEIEDVLGEHPAVAEAAVVGIPDPEWGETVAAAVVLRPGAVATPLELQQWVRARLRSTKTPQVIQIRDELPYNETGKLLRRVIRDEIAGQGAGAGG